MGRSPLKAIPAGRACWGTCPLGQEGLVHLSGTLQKRLSSLATLGPLQGLPIRFSVCNSDTLSVPLGTGALVLPVICCGQDLSCGPMKMGQTGHPWMGRHQGDGQGSCQMTQECAGHLTKQ